MLSVPLRIDSESVPKPRVWKLKDEDTARLLTHEISAKEMMMLLKLMTSRRSGY